MSLLLFKGHRGTLSTIPFSGIFEHEKHQHAQDRHTEQSDEQFESDIRNDWRLAGQLNRGKNIPHKLLRQKPGQVPHLISFAAENPSKLSLNKNIFLWLPTSLPELENGPEHSGIPKLSN